mmetsp:Transcript_20344/g.44047  ORF Transcript_20344/g.44047 Transcript_20344/m.44047 type:complete len:233 (+) Transcript_20344:1732-2430(+)
MFHVFNLLFQLMLVLQNFGPRCNKVETTQHCNGSGLNQFKNCFLCEEKRQCTSVCDNLSTNAQPLRIGKKMNQNHVEKHHNGMHNVNKWTRVEPKPNEQHSTGTETSTHHPLNSSRGPIVPHTTRGILLQGIIIVKVAVKVDGFVNGGIVIEKVLAAFASVSKLCWSDGFFVFVLKMDAASPFVTDRVVIVPFFAGSLGGVQLVILLGRANVFIPQGFLRCLLHVWSHAVVD